MRDHRTDPTPDPTPAPAAHEDDAQLRALAKQHFEGRRTSSLSDLLARRQELRGVHAVADLLGDAVRWSA